MCGIAGFLDFTCHSESSKLQSIVQKMSDTLIHRGPDDSGIWVDAKFGIALGHRRLSILDLSPQGHQPMISASGRYVITYNGEIYNYRELKDELNGKGCAPTWRGHSDTEVLLAVIEAYGVETSLKKLNGMFAFALWDKSEKILALARDRFGKKPLYYGWVNSTFVFASELKALRAYPGFQGQIDRDAVSLYVRFGYVPTPYSIYKNIHKLPQASFLEVNPSNRADNEEPVCYWSLLKIAEHSVHNKIVLSNEETTLQLESLLMDAVKIRMESDVPLGAFLSGGIDSSTVTALMQAQSTQKIKTFSIGFHESDYNEADHAKAVANHLGTEHTELYVTPLHALSVIPRLPEYYDEPFSDSSQIPTCLISEMTKQYVTVALSGDGGDEIFAGYNRYSWGQRLWRTLACMPLLLRIGIANILFKIKPGYLKKFLCFLPEMIKLQNADTKIRKIADVLSLDSQAMIYRRLVTLWHRPEDIVVNAMEPKGVIWDDSIAESIPNFIERMQFLDMVTYLPDDILVKVDRASMSVSLETRSPLLDYRVAEFSWLLPVDMKIGAGQTKWILRQVLQRFVPNALTIRPKMGFGVPIDAWLRGPLREWAEDLLDEQRLQRDGFFYHEPVREKWSEHISGKNNWQNHLWGILMFQSWLDYNRN